MSYHHSSASPWEVCDEEEEETHTITLSELLGIVDYAPQRTEQRTLRDPINNGTQTQIVEDQIIRAQGFLGLVRRIIDRASLISNLYQDENQRQMLIQHRHRYHTEDSLLDQEEEDSNEPLLEDTMESPVSDYGLDRIVFNHAESHKYLNANGEMDFNEPISNRFLSVPLNTKLDYNGNLIKSSPSQRPRIGR
jgi:hypothetical protein